MVGGLGGAAFAHRHPVGGGANVYSWDQDDTLLWTCSLVFEFPGLCIFDCCPPISANFPDVFFTVGVAGQKEPLITSKALRPLGKLVLLVFMFGKLRREENQHRSTSTDDRPAEGKACGGWGTEMEDKDVGG